MHPETRMIVWHHCWETREGLGTRISMSQSETEQQKRQRGMKGDERTPMGNENREMEDQPENAEMKPMQEEPRGQVSNNETWSMQADPKQQRRKENREE
jgi:hypothetical protein